MVVVKILINGKEYGVDMSENNYAGEVEIHDTFHCEAEEDGCDTIFGTNDPMVTIRIDDDEEEHGCFDCTHFDGGNCINPKSNYYGCHGGECATDCHEWEGGE